MSPPPQQQRKSPAMPGPLVQARNVNRWAIDMFKVVTIVQQIMTELRGTVSEQENIVFITKSVLNLMKQNGNQSSYAFQSHKDVAFNANVIRRQRYELRKQLQSVKIDMALFSDTYIKPHERFPLQNYHFYRANRFRVEKIERGPHILPVLTSPSFSTSHRGLHTDWKQ